MAVRLTPTEVADIIEAFLKGTDGRWDWDDFCSSRITDPALDAIRVRCVDLHDEDPYLGTPFDVGSLEAHSPAMRPTDELFRMPGSHATFEEDR
jgi:hypothetical protein